MKKLFLLSTFLIFTCSSYDDNCFTIIDKIISENEFVFVGDSNTSYSDNEGSLNGYANINLPVSEDVFNSYDEGDNYCYK